ncbi:MAG: amidophosphoribosyltransferase [Burkholderiales bacterium]|jgi:amidophosphoribosyltransferase|nr:amidophosphoribosyltransferase [Burkholderiales bacterium]
MCGIIGIVSNGNATHTLISSLKGLQHRGQQSAGVGTMDGNLMYLKKYLGLVKEVITEYDMTYLRGNAGIGHVRYPTAGSANDPEQAHPFYVNSPFGIMLAHNGNLTNALELRDDVLKKNHRHVRTHSDSEILTNVFAFELEQLTIHKTLDNDKIFQAISNLNERIRGGYAVVCLIANYGLIAFRDPNGIRPLAIGEKETANSSTYLISSESCAIEINGFNFIRDINPGEAVIITLDGKLESRICHPQPSLNICIFEYVYLSRPDSIIEKVSVQHARRNMGHYLAKSIDKLNLDIDVVIPIPDTSRVIGIEVAQKLGIPYREGFVKNHFTGRTFMLANHEQRQIAVRNKLSPIALEFRDKNVLLVDDSIVRGTTSKEIIDIIRKCGAKKVYIASAAPQVRYPNVYGIDMPTHEELIAYKRNDIEIAKEIGADGVIFQKLEDLKSSISDINPDLVSFEASCFDGKYITGDITEEYLHSLYGVGWHAQ